MAINLYLIGCGASEKSERSQVPKNKSTNYFADTYIPDQKIIKSMKLGRSIKKLGRS